LNRTTEESGCKKSGGKKLSLLPNCSDRLWLPPTFLSNW